VPLSQPHILQFQTYILDWYSKYGRHNLPWRTNYDPYHVLISEVMLQQTQVSRVIPKFLAFLDTFPTIKELAQATPKQIIQSWQGLGYNRRGLYLQKTAAAVMEKHNGIIPQTQDQLLKLPGVGPYTATAVAAFAFNKPVVVIETNIRAIYIHHFFAHSLKGEVPDTLLIPYIESTLYAENPRLWYSALMDYGSQLKLLIPNPSRKSKQYTKQSSFKGSFRQLRGSLLKQLTNTEKSLYMLAEGVPEHFSQKEVELALVKLESEGFITKKQSTYSLKEKVTHP
jgi:A/G-specific adenine glycosylase